MDELAREIIAYAIEIADVRRLQRLAHDGDKATAKAARKALHVLRTRGVEAPVPPRPVHEVGKLETTGFGPPRPGSRQEANNALLAAAVLAEMGQLRRRRRKAGT